MGCSSCCPEDAGFRDLPASACPLPPGAVDDALRRSQLRWPAVAFDADQCRAHIATVCYRMVQAGRRFTALHLEELCLASAIQSRDRAAWAACYTENRDLLIGMARRRISHEDAEGVVQDLFESLPDRVAMYDGRSSLRGWLSVSVVSRACDHYRRHDRRRVSPDGLNAGVPSGESGAVCPCAGAMGPTGEVGRFAAERDRSECQEFLRGLFPAAIDGMKPEWSLALKCRYLDGMTNREIAATVFSVPEYNISRWISKALPQLGKRLVSAASRFPGGRERLLACLDLLKDQ